MSNINRKVLFSLITMLILLQVSVFICYERCNQNIARNDTTNLLIQQNMIFIQRILSAPSSEAIIKKNHLPNSFVSISSLPRWTIKDTSSSLWHIYNTLRHQKPPIRISIRTRKNEWLNIEIKPFPNHASFRYIFLGVVVIINSFLGLLLWTIYRHTVPLRLIEDAAKCFGIHLHSLPLQMKGPLAARHAFAAINEMQTKINKLIQERTMMLASISHDLRTPLTSMRLRNELIDQDEIRLKNDADIHDMESMISQLLWYSKEDYLLQAKTRINLTAAITSLCHDYQDKGCEVKFVGSENKNIIVWGCLLSLKRALTNIINNAIKYGSLAEIDLTIGNKVKILIRDHGPGIQDEHVEKVFLPFYRLDNSHSRKSGIGLGLAIARDIISAHSGEIGLERAESGGLLVVIALPLAEL